MKRYFILAGVEHESKDGRYCLYEDVEKLEKLIRLYKEKYGRMYKNEKEGI